MAAFNRGEINEERKGRNNAGVRTYVRKFKVETTANEGAYGAGSAPGLPLIGSLHNEDPSAWCEDVAIDPISKKHFNWWIYTANYTSARSLNTNPLLEPAFHTWSTETFEKEISQERDGSAIVNTAGDFIYGVVRDDSRFQVVAEKNVISLPGSVTVLIDRLNSGSFTIDGYTAPKNTAKLSSLSLGPKEIRNSVEYRVLSLTIQFRDDKWKSFPPNVGMRCRDSIDPQKRCMIFNDGDYTPVTEPVPLDLSGNQVPNPNDFNVLRRDVDRYFEGNFNDLNNYIT